MTLKTLLLGSAATFAVVGGAQAADLSVAEPVEYVKVCDYFGTGYWYIPGTDTCIRVSGFVRFDTAFHANTLEYSAGGSVHSAAWNFNTQADIEVLAKSLTEYGVLAGDVQYDDNTHAGNGYNGSNSYISLDHATLSLGALQAGYVLSLFDYGGNLGTAVYHGIASTVNTNGIRLTWAAAGFGLGVAVEDPRDRWGSAQPTDYSTPDIIGKLTTTQANWDGALSAAYTGANGGGWAIQAGATFKLDAIAKGDAFRIQGAYADNANSFVSGGGDYAAPVLGRGSNYSVLGAFEHFWAPTLSTSVYASYLAYSGYSTGTTIGGPSVWSAGADLIWQPVSGFLAGPSLRYISATGTTSSAWVVDFRMQRSW